MAEEWLICKKAHTGNCTGASRRHDGEACEHSVPHTVKEDCKFDFCMYEFGCLCLPVEKDQLICEKVRSKCVEDNDCEHSRPHSKMHMCGSSWCTFLNGKMACGPVSTVTMLKKKEREVPTRRVRVEHLKGE